MVNRRSRNGCLTCRKRKLKCDEQRPTCGQCTKSRRECVPTEGVAFRHEQNPGMGEDSLKNFFKYRNVFTPEQVRSFLPIPQQVQFIHVQDPYAEDTDPPASPSQYQAVAAHSLEALSTAATDANTYGQAGTFPDYTATYGSPNASRAGYGPARGDLSGTGPQGPNQNYNINSLLNPSSTPANMIDPNLDGMHAFTHPGETKDDVSHLDDHPHGVAAGKPDEIKIHEDEDEAQIQLLRNFAQEAEEQAG